jgi:Fe-S-cluster-containing dehydrogenase component/Ni/Fe-hydrogenase subunit HybB-like protein
MSEVASGTAGPEPTAAVPLPVRWAKVIDHQRCIGCHACTTACKSENEVPVGVTRTYVKYVDVGVFPQARRAFQVTRCNQCDLAPCTTACPTSAMFRRPDGIVDFDKSICIGCKACMAACPYDAIFINPEDHSAEKCNFCAHRLDLGLEPACVVVCPTEAILVGNLDDPDSQVARIVHREPVAARRPEKGTLPKLFYRGAHQATLDPLAARRPPGGLFMWSQQTGLGPGASDRSAGPLAAGQVVSGHPSPANSSAAAVLAYDVPHSIPWDWRVSLYTLTKGIAAGVYLVALLLMALGRLGPASRVWLLDVPVIAGFFLAATGGLLIWDLEHPWRFYLIFTRPQWRSWLVRGAFLIGGYALVLALHVLAALGGRPELTLALIWAGLPLALATAVYTAYLFAQAKARDLWQNPLLPPHLSVQAMLAGAAVLLPAVILHGESRAFRLLAAVLGAAAVLHLALVAGEQTLAHVTEHARLAAQEMVRGRFRAWFWAGAVLVAGAAALAFTGAWPGGPDPDMLRLAAAAGASAGAKASVVMSVPATVLTAMLTAGSAPLLALAGLLAFEHAYVQAGQSVPLA